MISWLHLLRLRLRLHHRRPLLHRCRRIGALILHLPLIPLLRHRLNSLLLRRRNIASLRRGLRLSPYLFPFALTLLIKLTSRRVLRLVTVFLATQYGLLLHPRIVRTGVLSLVMWQRCRRRGC